MLSRPAFQRRAGTAAVALAIIVALPAAQTMNAPVKLTAFAVNLDSLTAPTGAGIVELAINRWSTDAEREQLFTAAIEKGPEKLLDVLQNMKSTGYIRTPNSLAYDLRYAHRMPADEGRDRIVLATDRYISFWEAANRPRSIDYPFVFIELRIGKDGEGEGKMSIATKIIPDKKNNTLVLENYGTQPVMLKQVKRQSGR